MTKATRVSKSPLPGPPPQAGEGAAFRHWHAALILLAIPLLVVGDVLFSSGRVLSAYGTDLSHLFLGVREFGFRELAHGRFPLWNPYLFCGAPFFAGFQSALLYPPNWVYAVLPIGAAVNVDVTFHLWLGGLFTYAWAANRRLHSAASILAGVVFTLGGTHFLHVYAGHLPQLATIAWTPLVLLAIDATLDAATTRSRVGWGLVGSAALPLQILAGFPQFVLYLGIVVGVYVALRVVVDGRRRLPTAGALLLFVSLGAGISAVQWVAALGVVGESARHRLPWAVASAYFLPSENLLLMLAPGLFGDGGTVAPYWGRWSLWEALPFVGVVPLILAAYGLVRTPARQRWPLVAALLLALLLAFGPVTPLFAFVYEHVPTTDGFRGPSKFALPFLAWLALLVGVGFDKLIAGNRLARPLPWLVSTLAVLLLVAAACVFASAKAGPNGVWSRALLAIEWGGMRFQNPPDDASIVAMGTRATQAVLLAGITVSLAAVALLVARHRPRLHRPATAVLLILGVTELVTFARHFRPTFSLAEADAERDGLARAAADLPPDVRFFYLNQSAALRAEVPTLWGNDAMLLQRYVDLANALNGIDRVTDATLSPFARPLPPHELLRLAAVVSRNPAGRFTAYKLPTEPFPRALLVPGWKVVPDRVEAGRLLRRPDFPRRNEVLLETDPGLPTGTLGGPPPSLAIGNLSTDAIEIDASTPVPCVLLITDNYAAGWKATPLEPGPQASYQVLPADVAFRGIPLVPGHHHLRLEYDPPAFRVGKWISIASVLAWLTIVAWWLKPGWITKPSPSPLYSGARAGVRGSSVSRTALDEPQNP